MFLEERFPSDLRLGATYSDQYPVDTTVDPRTGKSYARLRSAQPSRALTGQYVSRNDQVWAGVLDLYHRAFGALAGFRVHFDDDDSSNGMTGTPTPTDQPAVKISAAAYQLAKQYGTGTPLAIGRPTRAIRKPVAGSVRVSVDGVESLSGWTVDTTTGIVTFAVPPPGSAVVAAGFRFDVPCRFSERFDITHVGARYRETGTINLVEIINPD